MRLFKKINKVEADGRDREISNKKIRVSLIKYLYPGISVFMLALLAVLAIFLYFNAYLSISHAQNVALLKQQILEEDLKSGDLARVVKTLNEKTSSTPINLESAKNPFIQKWEIKK